jgi:hypothetical protein
MANIQHLGFITYKIMPFIIIAYLVISSLLSGTTKGFHLLAGIMITNVIVIMVSRIPQIQKYMFQGTDGTEYLGNMQKCNLITMDMGTPLSYLPLSSSIISFVFAYFIHIIRTAKEGGKNISRSVAGKNIGLILMLLILFLYDIYYHLTTCNTVGMSVFIPVLIGIFMGIIWAASTDNANRMGVAGMAQSEKCSTTDSGTYKCNISDGTDTIAF